MEHGSFTPLRVSFFSKYGLPLCNITLGQFSFCFSFISIDSFVLFLLPLWPQNQPKGVIILYHY